MSIILAFLLGMASWAVQDYYRAWKKVSLDAKKTRAEWERRWNDNTFQL